MLTALSGEQGGDNVVEARGLSKRHGAGGVAVQDLDLTVRRDEVYGFLAPNAAGKTTTLRSWWD